MEKVFEGSRLVYEFDYDVSEREKISGRIYERWEDANMSQTSHCGASVRLRVAKTTGISKSDLEKVEAEIGWSFGVPKISEIKGGISAASEHQVTFSESVTVEREFEVTSSPCGSRCIKIFRKCRDVHLTFRKQNFWGRWIERRTILPEKTECVDAPVTIEEFDDRCGCKKADTAPVDGAMTLSIRKLSVSTPIFITPSGFRSEYPQLDFDVSVEKLLGRGVVDIELEAAALPEMVRFLAGVNEERLAVSLHIDDVFGALEMPVLQVFNEAQGIVGSNLEHGNLKETDGF